MSILCELDKYFINLRGRGEGIPSFFFKFRKTEVLFMGPLIPLFWISGDVCPGFQSQGGSLCVLSRFCDPQIHLWCDTGWLYRGQNGSQAITCRHWWRFRARTHLDPDHQLLTHSSAEQRTVDPWSPNKGLI